MTVGTAARHVVAVPDNETRRRLGELPPGIEAVVWDPRDDPAVAGVDTASIDVVLIPPYFFSHEGFGRLAALPRLAVIQLPSAGFEHALPYLPAGVTLCNGRGVHDEETAELALGLLLASMRGIGDAVRDMREHHWRLRIRHSLAESRVALIGFGSIGSTIARYLRPHDVDVVPFARRARTERIDGVDYQVRSLDALDGELPSVQAVVIIVPSTPQTRHLLDARRLALLPDGAHVVNVARGPIVDTDALVAELQAGRLAAALDVTDPEPLPAGHPLWDAPNTIVTPHVGGATQLSDIRTAQLMRAQIERLASGEPLSNVVAGPGIE